jgi:hypothetical protein
MIFFISIFHIFLLLSIAHWANKKWNDVDSKIYWAALLFKISLAICVGLIYRYYYPGHDTWNYFKDAEQLANLAKSDFTTYSKAMLDSDANMVSHQIISNTEWRSVFFVKVLSIFCLLTNNSYWICAAWFGIISFLSCWHIHKVICRWKPQAVVASAIAFLFFPSIAFWGSGIEKETLALSGLLFLSASMIDYWRGEKLNLLSWILILTSIFFVWKLRYFWLGVYLLIVVPTLIIIYLFKRKVNIYVSVLCAIVIFTIVFSSLPYLHPNFSSDLFLEMLVGNSQQVRAISSPNNTIHFYELTATWASVILNSPLALISGLFRPFIWEASGILGFLAALENIFLLVMTLFSFTKLKKVIHSKDLLLMASAFTYIIILCIFLSLSTPNFGSLSRYRIGFLPFFVFMVCCDNPLMLRIQKMFKAKDIQ